MDDLSPAQRPPTAPTDTFQGFQPSTTPMPPQESLFDFPDPEDSSLPSSGDPVDQGTGRNRQIPGATRRSGGPAPLKAELRDGLTPDPAEIDRRHAGNEPHPGAAGDGGIVAEGDAVRPLAEGLAEVLQKSVSPEQYQTWFKRSRLVRVDDASATLAVSNGFARDWIVRHYTEVLTGAVEKLLGQSRRVVVAVQPESLLKDPAPYVAMPPPVAGAPEGATTEASGPGAQGPLTEEERRPKGAGTPGATGQPVAPAPPRPRPATVAQLESSSDFALNEGCTFDKFVVGPCNRFGHAASMGAAEQPGKSYNPLFLYGRVGVGKTHLLQAFCFSVLERFPDYRILYLSCETFVNHFISALDTGNMQRFRDKYRDIDVLVVDDIQILANKDKTQEEFFHTFNSLYNEGKQIVLSSDSPPKDIPTLHDRLISRFKWGMVTEVEPPCYETRMAIVKRKCRLSGIDVPDDVAQFIAENIEENVRELEGAVIRLHGYLRMTGAEISLELAREALAGIIHVRKGAPTVGDIIDLVIEHYQVKLSDLQSKRRTKAIAFPRQVAMYLARKVTRHSLEEIGGFFGGRDHTTVLYAVDKMEKLIVTDMDLATNIQKFMDRLGQSGRS